MQIIHHLIIDMTRPLPQPPVGAVQGDGCTRAVHMTLLQNGSPWEVPAGVTAAVAFRKPDKTRGLYDRLPDGTSAVTIDGSTVTAVLAPQVLSCAGEVSAAVVFHDADLNQLASFPFAIRVAVNPAAGQAVSNDYYRYTTLAAVNEAMEVAEATLRAAQTRMDWLSAATTIVRDASGSAIALSDSADAPLQGLTLYGKTTQNGTPTPESPAALETVGNRGAVTVSVTNGTDEPSQTLTVSTPNGLPGIPVASGGNYTDENGQSWICDEIDFGRGLYVQRICTEKVTADMYRTLDAYGSGGYYRVRLTTQKEGIAASGYCKFSHFKANYTWNIDAEYAYVTSAFTAYIFTNRWSTKEAFAAWLEEQSAAGTPFTIMYKIAEPIETALSAEELAQYAALHSNKPNTTVFNDAGAVMKLRYTADTKTYIDEKISTLSAAMLA